LIRSLLLLSTTAASAPAARARGPCATAPGPLPVAIWVGPAPMGSDADGVSDIPGSYTDGRPALVLDRIDRIEANLPRTPFRHSCVIPYSAGRPEGPRDSRGHAGICINDLPLSATALLGLRLWLTPTPPSGAALRNGVRGRRRVSRSTARLEILRTVSVVKCAHGDMHPVRLFLLTVRSSAARVTAMQALRRS